MKCFLCRSANLEPAPFKTAPPYSTWYRCRDCGSDTADCRYNSDLYQDGLSQVIIDTNGGIEACRRQVIGNAEWFDRFARENLGRDFLDVGCGDGAMLDVMAARGWSVHGFDVCRPHYAGSHVTVAPVFNRWLFPRLYAVVNCREVIEHVPYPELLLHELHGCCLPGGLVQIQTPVPVDHFDPGVYSVGHLFVASETKLKEMMAAAHLEVLDELHWGNDRQAGQAYLCRAKT